MKRIDIGLLRLAAQRISADQFDTPAAVVKHLLALQAQDYNGSLWSIGLRTKHSTQNDVEHAVRNRQIVRSWPMRGTLHFMHADDIYWLLDLLATRATAAAKNRRIQQLGLTDAIVEAAERALRTALKGGAAIRRDEVVKLFKRSVRGIDIDNQHTQHLMRNFGERGVICFGPPDGKQPTFVLLEDWIPRPKPKPRAEALAELAQRYFVGHGPASLKDFAGWGMLTMTDAKAGLAAAANLDSFELDGNTYYCAPNLRPVKKHQPILLPGFDEYLLGYKDRSAVLASEYASRVVPGGNGMFLPTVVDQGQVVGLWKRQLRKAGVSFTYSGFTKDLKPATKSEQRYSSFIG